MTVQNVTIGVPSDFRASSNRFFLPGAGEFSESLNLGQIIKGKVMRQFDGTSRYLVAFDGHERVVDSAIPLTTGELIHGRVVAIGDRVEVQRVHPSEENARQAQLVEPNIADRFIGMSRQEKLFNEYATRFQVQMDASDKSVLMRASRLAGDADAMTLVGMMVSKLGLRQTPELLWPVYRALVREDSSSAALNVSQDVPQLAAVAGADSNLQSTTVRQLADLILKQVGQREERKDNNDATAAPRSSIDKADAQSSAIITPVGMQQNQEDGGNADPRQLAHRLLNAQTGGAVAHRIGTVPLLLGDKLVEVDLSFFEQQKERSAVAGIKHRKVMFSLQMERLGNVDIAATLSGTRVRLQIATSDQEATAAASAHMQELREALAANGWEIDEIAYETRQADSQNGVVRSVVDHIISQDSLNRLV